MVTDENKTNSMASANTVAYNKTNSSSSINTVADGNKSNYKAGVHAMARRWLTTRRPIPRRMPYDSTQTCRGIGTKYIKHMVRYLNTAGDDNKSKFPADAVRVEINLLAIFISTEAF